MAWIALGLFTVGTACGATLRLSIFVLILLGATVLAGVIAGLRGSGDAILNAVLTLVLLQVGYAAGVVLRAALRAWRGRVAGAAVQGPSRSAVRAPGQHPR